MRLIETVVIAIWAMGPAYVPNNAAVLLGGEKPIDGGRTVGGSRLLGDGKTWRGTIMGTLAGAVVALVLNLIAPTVSTATGIAMPTFPPLVLVALPFGAMVGDIVASGFKRRTGRERGAAFPGLDQYDFVIGGLVFAALAAIGWFVETFTPPVLLAVLVLTPLLHVGTNVIAYRVGLKSEPW